MELAEELRAIEHIRQLKARYFRFVDTHDWDGLATLFCRDAHFETPGMRSRDNPGGTGGCIVEGQEAIAAFLRQAMATARSVHHGHGHEVEILSPTTARGIIAMEDIVDWDGPPAIHIHGHGHYTEDYAYEDGAWRIRRSVLTRLRIVMG